MNYMKKNGYFHDVTAETPTRFWINNPTIKEAKLAIEAGAVGCTTNPAYSSKMLLDADESVIVKNLIREALPHYKNDDDVASVVQRSLVKRLTELFMPIYSRSNGKEGFVTIQCNPLLETGADYIISDGRESRKISPNIMVKIPVTDAGIAAIETLARENNPVMATEVMAVSQAISICEAYKSASVKSGNSPAFYVTHITGILDDYFREVVKLNNLSIPKEILSMAGISIAKKQYKLLKERNYPGRMLGGGARKLEDFTAFVGGDLSITINWKGFAEELIRTHPPVTSLINDLPDSKLVERLMSDLPDYKKAWDDSGMKEEEFFEYGGVELFRNSFIKGWNDLKSEIAAQRKL